MQDYFFFLVFEIFLKQPFLIVSIISLLANISLMHSARTFSICISD